MTDGGSPGTMSFVRYRLAALAIVASGWALACGPSFQVIYEGDVRFEHCYAVDESKRAPTPEKLACWHDWLTTFTYGQTADRVEYAAARYHVLKTDGSPFAVDALAEAPPERPRQTIGGPEPTSAFVSPQNVVPPPVTARKQEPLGIAARPPGYECGDECTKSWRDCRRACNDGECARCDNSSRACMAACYGGESRSVPPPRR
jgi:hypothetical protein